jgi:hypothetical protein
MSAIQATRTPTPGFGARLPWKLEGRADVALEPATRVVRFRGSEPS